MRHPFDMELEDYLEWEPDHLDDTDDTEEDMPPPPRTVEDE